MPFWSAFRWWASGSPPTTTEDNEFPETIDKDARTLRTESIAVDETGLPFTEEDYDALMQQLERDDALIEELFADIDYTESRSPSQASSHRSTLGRTSRSSSTTTRGKPRPPIQPFIHAPAEEDDDRPNSPAIMDPDPNDFLSNFHPRPSHLTPRPRSTTTSPVRLARTRSRIVTPPSRLPTTPTESHRAPPRVQKRGGRKPKKFRCPNCNCWITITPAGNPSTVFETWEGTVGRRVEPVVPKIEPVEVESPLGYTTYRHPGTGKLFLKKKN
jgi:hypothetical protein